MLLANVPHALLSLSSHHWYSQTLCVKDRARNPPTLQLELGTLARPSTAIDIVSSCYGGRLQGPDLRIRAVHIDHVIRAVSSEDIASRRPYTKSYTRKIVQVFKKHEWCNTVCRLWANLGLQTQSDTNCWPCMILRVSKLCS
jgi:hypothetical protein